MWKTWCCPNKGRRQYLMETGKLDRSPQFMFRGQKMECLQHWANWTPAYNPLNASKSLNKSVMHWTYAHVMPSKRSLEKTCSKFVVQGLTKEHLDVISILTSKIDFATTQTIADILIHRVLPGRFWGGSWWSAWYMTNSHWSCHSLTSLYLHTQVNHSISLNWIATISDSRLDSSKHRAYTILYLMTLIKAILLDTLGSKAGRPKKKSLSKETQAFFWSDVPCVGLKLKHHVSIRSL